MLHRLTLNGILRWLLLSTPHAVTEWPSNVQPVHYSDIQMGSPLFTYVYPYGLVHS